MKGKIKRLQTFLTEDIWRISEKEVSKSKQYIYKAIKAIYVSIKSIQQDDIIGNASALTYSTLLSIVPILAILFAIAKGFGFSTLMERQIHNTLGSQKLVADSLIKFVNSYLDQTKSGVFIGVGLVLLLWTIVSLTSDIEQTFNTIWQVKKSRTFYRKVTDYFSMFLLFPILIVVSAGLTIFMGTTMKQMPNFLILGPFLKFLVRLIPYTLTCGMFIGLYIFMPNTKVKIKNTLIPGILAGTVYQAFQFLYISGQISISKYNAIYGSFAALPLFLLWLQISWTIILFGAELNYVCQNLGSFNYKNDTQNISRRYRDFFCIIVMSLICKRFANAEPPLCANELSEINKIPVRLTYQIINQLEEIGLIHEIASDAKSETISYLPSIDTNLLSVGLLIDRIDRCGSEEFEVDKELIFKPQWDALTASRNFNHKDDNEILLKNL